MSALFVLRRWNGTAHHALEFRDEPKPVLRPALGERSIPIPDEDLRQFTSSELFDIYKWKAAQ